MNTETKECPKCEGSGVGYIEDGIIENCYICNGKGSLPICPMCKGSGNYIDDQTCYACEGIGGVVN